ncbi:glycosyltransferase [Candidatus Altiarchaeota archaeon]
MFFWKEKPSVSIVVPTYNRSHLLGECLDSLSKQTFQKNKLEIIFVDDGSRDDTKKVVEEYQKKDNRIKYLFQENRGQPSARNLGISESKGEIICFLDDDCIADEYWVEELVKGYSNEKIGGVGGKITGPPPKTLVEKYSEDAGIISQQKFIDKFIVTANASYLRSVLDEVGGFQEGQPASEDTDLGVRVKMAGYELGYRPTATVLHKHRSTVKGLVKQQFWYGRGHAFLGQKYAKHFKASQAIGLGLRRILLRIVLYPFNLLSSLFSENRRYQISKPIFEVLRQSSYLMGIIYGLSIDPKYEGKKIEKKISFLGNL